MIKNPDAWSARLARTVAFYDNAAIELGKSYSLAVKEANEAREALYRYSETGRKA